MKGSNVLAFLGGAVVGGVVALLLAPKSGRETRQQIMDFVEDEYGQAKDFVNKNVDKAREVVDRGRKIVEEEISNVKSAICEEMDEMSERKRSAK